MQRHNIRPPRTPSHNSHLIPMTTSSCGDDSHSLRTWQTPSVIHSILPHNQNTCQLHFHCVRILWKCIRCHCFGIRHHLQLSRQGGSLQAHPFPPFCLWAAPSFQQTNICVSCLTFAKDACQAFATTTQTCTARQPHNQALFRPHFSALFLLRQAALWHPHHMLQLWLPLSQGLSWPFSHGRRQCLPLQ